VLLESTAGVKRIGAGSMNILLLAVYFEDWISLDESEGWDATYIKRPNGRWYQLITTDNDIISTFKKNKAFLKPVLFSGNILGTAPFD
jgi:hypothetical protein